MTGRVLPPTPDKTHQAPGCASFCESTPACTPGHRIQKLPRGLRRERPICCVIALRRHLPSCRSSLHLGHSRRNAATQVLLGVLSCDQAQAAAPRSCVCRPDVPLFVPLFVPLIRADGGPPVRFLFIRYVFLQDLMRPEAILVIHGTTITDVVSQIQPLSPRSPSLGQFREQ